MALELRSVTRVVGGATHIHETDLALAPGTMNVLLGPTLAGKTTLMRLMAGLDRPTTGRILWDGEDVTGMRVQDRAVAMVYQQFINYPSMTVRDNIASPLRLLSADRAEIDRRVGEVAALMKLDGMLDRRPLELSGGQQQRCALARALVKDARLVLLDEPLANLDYKLREELRAEIPRIFAASGAIFVYATTEPEEALLLAARELQGPAVEEGRQVHQGAGLAHAPVDLGLRLAHQPHGRGDVLVDRQAGVVDELLIDHGDAAVLDAHAGDVLAAPENAPFRGLVQPRH